MKKNIRKEMLQKRDMLSVIQVEELSNEIQSNVLHWDKFINSSTIMLYSDFKNEVITKGIIESCLEKNKKVILPKVIKESRDILPCLITGFNELNPGTYGIFEPDGINVIDKNEIELVIVPGVAFDASGYRIGYGAGYYDRFLKGYNGIKAGICYSIQLVKNAWPDQFDIKMDYLITERGIINTHNNL